jgi:hypothetical protein
MEDLTRRNFMAAGAAVTAAIAAPAILGAQSKSGTKLPVIGEGEYMYEVHHDWAMENLPADIKYGNTHSISRDSHGLIYVHHTVHETSKSPNAVVVFDPKGKFVTSWGPQFRGGAHGMHIQMEGKTEYIYFCDDKHGFISKKTLKGEDVWTLAYPQQSPVYFKGLGAKGPGGAAGLNYRPTNIAINPANLDFWVGDGYGAYYMFHYKQASSTSYPVLVNTFGGPPPPAPGGAVTGAIAGPAGAGAAKGGGGGARGGPGAAKGGDAALTPPPGAGAAKGGDAQAKGGPGAAKGGGGGGRAARPPAPLDSMNNPHGNWIDTRDPKNPVLLVADRGNQRIVRYTLDDKPIDLVEGTGQFCHFNQRGDLLMVPDLGSKVHIVKGNKVVATFGGPPQGTAAVSRTTENRSDFRPGEFVAPHGGTFDADGNIYIGEWVEIGRVTKLKKV